MTSYTNVSGKTNEDSSSTILGGYNCSISYSSNPNFKAGENSHIFPTITPREERLNSIYSTLFSNLGDAVAHYVPQSVMPKMKKIRIRYNHKCTSSKDMWKIWVDDKLTIASQVNFQIPTCTTLDYDEEGKDYKAHISCNAINVKIETLPDEQVIVTIS